MLNFNLKTMFRDDTLKASAAAALTQTKILMAASQLTNDGLYSPCLNLTTNGTDRKDKILGQRSFKCPDCGKMYGLKRNLLRHSKFECNKEPQFHCPFCPQKFKQKCHVLRHATRLHPQCSNILGFGGSKINLPV
ncbi:Longitudinals lacking protein, isoforms A/B/D/L [Frankliniella fusca]|uniref:Longitudinals lacking protein, isoforms A/B/D/L n=1 Tax=Frankliniella fusca TaxID=407009 RepID=A0AAE1LCY5_9NEOP|nr:Longitudinals lacking protein, isoforms A/B/D/L [Frankliniella fusca]